jgi:hypothetical protein
MQVEEVARVTTAVQPVGLAVSAEAETAAESARLRPLAQMGLAVVVVVAEKIKRRHLEAPASSS